MLEILIQLFKVMDNIFTVKVEPFTSISPGKATVEWLSDNKKVIDALLTVIEYQRDLQMIVKIKFNLHPESLAQQELTLESISKKLFKELVANSVLDVKEATHNQNNEYHIILKLK